MTGTTLAGTTAVVFSIIVLESTASESFSSQEGGMYSTGSSYTSSSLDSAEVDSLGGTTTVRTSTFLLPPAIGSGDWEAKVAAASFCFLAFRAPLPLCSMSVLTTTSAANAGFAALIFLRAAS